MTNYRPSIPRRCPTYVLTMPTLLSVRDPAGSCTFTVMAISQMPPHGPPPPHARGLTKKHSGGGGVLRPCPHPHRGSRQGDQLFL